MINKYTLSRSQNVNFIKQNLQEYIEYNLILSRYKEDDKERQIAYNNFSKAYNPSGSGKISKTADNKDYSVSLKQATGFGGMISFEVKNSAYVSKILRNVRVFQYAESLGGVESLITFPKKQTHADVKEEILEALND